ncbi:MAG: hypothetical protein II996_00710 [Oscillospiraceae bacterium]|nr:hypothetical protein [Oscillospiraceae bacterium]
MTREEALRHRELNKELEKEREKLAKLRAKMYAPNTASFTSGSVRSGYHNSHVETVALRATAIEDRIYELERKIFREYINLISYRFCAGYPLGEVIRYYCIECLEWNEIERKLGYEYSISSLKNRFNYYFKKQEQCADEEVNDV